MGVYVEVRLETGKPLAFIQIFRATDQDQPKHSMPPMEPGRYRYQFTAEVLHPASQIAWHFKNEVEHERSDDILALLKAVIESIEQTQAAMQ
jgi:hypothetical protein